MTPELIVAFASYAFVTSITPGPNNTMLLTSGANHGLRATLPHLCGITIGFALLVAAVGLGLDGLFTAVPALHDLLRYGGAAYLIYLAWRIARSGAPGVEADIGRPMTFLEAAVFQWINPKAWIMAVGAMVTYTLPKSHFGDVALISVAFALVNAPCVFAWAALGTAFRHFLSRPTYLKVFNMTMAALLVASLYPILAEGASR